MGKVKIRVTSAPMFGSGLFGAYFLSSFFFLSNSPPSLRIEANRRRAERSIRAFFYVREGSRVHSRVGDALPARELTRDCNDSSSTLRIQSRRGDQSIPRVSRSLARLRQEERAGH